MVGVTGFVQPQWVSVRVWVRLQVEKVKEVGQTLRYVAGGRELVLLEGDGKREEVWLTGDDCCVDDSSWGVDEYFVERDMDAAEGDLALLFASVNNWRATAVFGWASTAGVAAV